MSRGHGEVERKVLDLLSRENATGKWMPVLGLGQLMQRHGLGHSESVRRACKKLADEGHVELGYKQHRDWRWWREEPAEVEVRSDPKHDVYNGRQRLMVRKRAGVEPPHLGSGAQNPAFCRGNEHACRS